MRKLQIRKNREGFTLAELLVTVAITVILASFGFVSVSGYQRRLKLTEMDNTAREIFIAAQNHLTSSEASGSWNSVYQTDAAESDFGVKVSASTLGISDSSDDYRAILSTRGKEPSDGDYATAWNEILPYGSITESVRTEGQYIVIYNASSASIYGVLYTDNSSNAFGSVNSEFSFDLSKLSEYLELVQKTQNERVSYESGNGHVYIGWYGGALSKADNSSSADAPSLYFDNAEILKLNFNYSGSNYSYAVLKFTGNTSGAEVSVKVKTGGISPVSDSDNSKIASKLNSSLSWKPVTGGISFSISLDDITRQGGNFGYIFDTDTSDTPAVSSNGTASSAKFISGEDITVTAYAVKEDGTQSAAVSASANSLFESNDGKNLTISNARHLQNLDQSVSGISRSFFANERASAELTRDITWTGKSISFIRQVSTLKNQQEVPASFKIYGIDPNVKPSSAFRSIENDFLTSFEGNDHILRGFVFGPGKKGNAGLFAENPNTGNTGKPFTIQNLFFKEATTATAGTKEGNAGILIGKSTNGLNIKKVFLDGTLTVKAESGSAGGMIGAVIEPGAGSQPDLVITASSIGRNQPANTYLSIQGKNGAGGLAGSISRSSVYLGCSSLMEKVDTKGVTISASSIVISSDTASGGLIGEADSVSSFAIRYAKISAESYAYITSKQGAAGGIAGSISSSAAAENQISIQISDSNFLSRTDKDNDLTPDKIEQVSGSTAAGGFIGSLSAANGTVIITDSFSNTYVRSSGNGSSAGGFIGILNSGSGSAAIERAYAAGRTKEASYQDAAEGQGRYNVTSTAENSFAGGFIGTTSGSLTIRSSFSNASVSDSGTDSVSAGFIAALNGNRNVTLSGCYSAGKVYGTDHSGAFLGRNQSGFFTASKCFVLKGSDFNDAIQTVLDNQKGSDTDGILTAAAGAADTPFAVEEKRTAVPNDSKLGSAYYPFMTTSQLNAAYFSGSAYDTNPNDNQYFGDWEIPISSCFAENGNKLTVHFNIPKKDKHTSDKFTIRVQGLTSKKVIYVPVKVSNGTISWENFMDYGYNKDPNWKANSQPSNLHQTTESAQYSMLRSEEYSEFKKAYQKSSGSPEADPIANPSEYDFYAIDFDDLTIKEHKFFSIFFQTGFIPGETIEFSVVSRWDSKFDSSDAGTVTFNSLFGNATDGDTAYIENSRHLENLDYDLSGLGIAYHKAIQKDNIHWDASSEPFLKKAGTEDFVSEMKKRNSSESLSLFGEYDEFSRENTFYPITNTSIEEYDGGGFTIENIRIDLSKEHGGNRAAAIFSSLADGVSIHDLTLNNVTATTGTAFGSAAGLVGSITNGTIKNVTLTGNSSISVLCSKFAGGIAAEANGSFSMSNCAVYGKNIVLTVSNWHSYAGGLVGKIDAGNNTVKISDSQAAVTIGVQNVSGSGDNSGGGLIGSVLNAGKGSSIERSQSGGQTEKGKYSSSKFNINLASAQSTGGGLIGRISDSNLEIRQCYSTASVSAVQTAGGLIGSVPGGTVKVNECYSTGLVGIDSVSGIFIGAAGDNAVSGADNFYLANINHRIPVIGSGSTTIQVSGGTAGSNPFVAGKNQVTVKYDLESLQNDYPFKTYTISDQKSSQTRHVGDWQNAGTESLDISNGDVLEAILKVDRSNITWNNLVNVAICGKKSGKVAFAKLSISEDNQVNIVSVVNHLYASFDPSSSEIRLVLDDISGGSAGTFDTENRDFSDDRRFAKMFSGFLPGEDIQIIADFAGTDTFQTDYVSNDSYFSAVTNSLFGDGSFNASYQSSLYSPAAEVISARYQLDKNNFSNTALIHNTRHLENLSYDVSLYSEAGNHVTIQTAKQYGDIDVSEYFRSESGRTHIFAYGANSDPNNSVVMATPENSLIGIYQKELLNYYGNGFSISNLRICGTMSYYDNNQTLDLEEAGLFALVDKNFSVSDLNINNPVIESSKYSGTLIGKIQRDAAVTISNVIVHGNDSKTASVFDAVSGTYAGGIIGYVEEASRVDLENTFAGGRNYRITGTQYAGGLIGYAYSSYQTSSYGKDLTISNCAVSAYVVQKESDKNSATGDYAAGGLIGYLNYGTASAKINNSYSSGHSAVEQSSSQNEGDIYSYQGNAGGLIGMQAGLISINNSFSTVSVYGADGNMSGGLIGYSNYAYYESIYSYLHTVSINHSYFAGKIIIPSNEQYHIVSPILNGFGETSYWKYHIYLTDVGYLDQGDSISGVYLKDHNGKITYYSDSALSINLLSSDSLKNMVVVGTSDVENTLPFNSSLIKKQYPYPIYTMLKNYASDSIAKRIYIGDWTGTENASAKVNFVIEEAPEDESEFFSEGEASSSPEASAGASAESTETPEASASAEAASSPSPSPSVTPEASPAASAEVTSTPSAVTENTDTQPSPSASAGGGNATPYLHAVKLSHPLLKKEETEETGEPSETPAADEPSDSSDSPQKIEGVETEEGDIVTEEDHAVTIERTVDVGKTISLSPIHPVEDGYTLVGWRLVDSESDEENTGSESLGVVDGSGNTGVVHYDYDPDAVVTVEGDMNLKAVFVSNDLLSFGNTWTSSVSAAFNPYPGNTNNCTWTAWQLVYETMGIRLPAWGDAGYWLIRAKAAGFTVSSEPAENSLVVFSNHVGFVTDVSADGQYVYIKEGNYSGMYHEGWWPAYGDRHGQKRYGYIWLSGSGTSDITEEELAEMEKEQAAREEAETEQKETEETIVISDGYYVGNNETALLQDLAEKGLSAGTRSEAYSNTAEAGTIIAHDSGTFAKGAAVNYTVSLGKEQVTEETAEPSLTPEASASASASSVPSASASASAPASSVSEITETVVPSASASAPAPSVSEITVTAAPAETSEPVNTPVPSVTEIEASPSAAASSAPAESAPVPSVKEIVPSASAAGEE